MLHLRCALIGVLTAVAASLLWVAGSLFAPVAVDLATDEGGLEAASVGPGAVVLVILIGFAAGYSFALGASRRGRPSSKQQPGPTASARKTVTGRGFWRRRRSRPLQ